MYLIFGAGGNGLVIYDTIKKNLFENVFFIDDNKTELINNVKIYNRNDLKNIPKHELIISIGNNTVRKIVSNSLESKYFNAIHPNSFVSQSVTKLGIGISIMANSVVNAFSEIGNHVIINSGAIVEHECFLKDFVHIAPNATLCGNVTVNEGAFIGAGSVILPGIRIGAWATVGAGSVVNRDVPDGVTVYGSPAKIKIYCK